MLYQTPERYRIGGYGQSLDGLEDVELRAVLTRASEMVNEFCLVSNRPQRHDFRGGTITNERSTWNVGNPMLEGQRRVILRHRPVKTVTGLRINVTNNQYITFDADELFVGDGWVEVTSLAYTSVGLFGGGILPGIGLRDPIAYASYTYGFSFSELGEYLETTDARLYRSMNQWWDSVLPPVVYRDGSVVSTGEYQIDYSEGTVSFTAAQSSEVAITVDYNYRLPGAIAEATGIIATELLADRSVAARGLIGLAELQVGEVRIRREMARGGSVGTLSMPAIPPRAAMLLAPYRTRGVG